MPEETLWGRAIRRWKSMLEVKLTVVVVCPWNHELECPIEPYISCRHLALIIEGAGADINVDPVLHAACSLDLQKFCRDIPPGEG